MFEEDSEMYDFNDFRKVSLHREIFDEEKISQNFHKNSYFFGKVNALDRKIKNTIANIYDDFVFVHESSLIPDNLKKVLNFLVKNKVVRNYYFKKNFNDDIPLYRFAIEAILPENYSALRPEHLLIGSGADLDPKNAVMKAIGEFLERYPLMLYDESNLHKSNINNLMKSKKLFVDPSNLNQLGPSEGGIDGNADYLWADVYDLNNKKYYIPAQCVFWTYKSSHEGFTEPFLREPNSNGCAGHFNMKDAVIAGLSEVIERHLFLECWLTKRGAKKIINIDSENEELRRILKIANDLEFDIAWYYIGEEYDLPAVVCFLIDKSGVGPFLSVGGGFASSIEYSMIKSFNEASGVQSGVRLDKKMLKSINVKKDKSFNRLHRLLYWAEYKRANDLLFFTEKGSCSFRDIASFNFLNQDEQIDFLKKSAEKINKNAKIYYYQAKNNILSDLGYKSLRVIVTGLQNLYLNEMYKPRTIVTNSGIQPIFNNTPHPFP